MGISAKVLQLVNSAFFGMVRPITSIPGAVSYLGVSTLKNLVLSVEVFRAFAPPRQIHGFSLGDLQNHSRLTAYLAARLPVPEYSGDIATLAGMFHDVGKLIMAWKFPERFERLVAEAQRDHCPLYKVEEREYGFTHAEIGAYLLGLWGLPYCVVEAVALHHHPERVPHQSFDVPSAVYIANLLAQDRSSAPRVDEEFVAHQEYLASLGVEQEIPHLRAMAAQAHPLLVQI